MTKGCSSFYEHVPPSRSVVATDLLELRPFAGVIRIAESDADYLRLPEATLDYNPPSVEGRTRIARGNTWDQRTELVHQALPGCLDDETEERWRLAENPAVLGAGGR